MRNPNETNPYADELILGEAYVTPADTAQTHGHAQGDGNPENDAPSDGPQASGDGQMPTDTPEQGEGKPKGEPTEGKDAENGTPTEGNPKGEGDADSPSEGGKEDGKDGEPTEGEGDADSTEPTEGDPELPRDGKAVVTSKNRHIVRKWLTRNEVRYSKIVNLTLEELQNVYNDLTDGLLNSLREKGEGKPKTPSEPKAPSEPKPKQEPKAPKVPKDEPKPEEPKAPDEDLEIKPLPKGEKPHCLTEKVARILRIGGFGALVFGPAGSGKTTLGVQVAKMLGLKFHFSGAVAKTYQLMGYNDAHGNYVTTEFRKAFEFGGLFLFDEVDASSPQVLLSVNAALANGFCDFPNGKVMAHPHFRCLASANTNGNGANREYSGRNKLDAATLDRFANFVCDYDDSIAVSVVNSMPWSDADKAKALEWCQLVVDYRQIARETSVLTVISPRAAINGARAMIEAKFPVRELVEIFILSKIGEKPVQERLTEGVKALHKKRKADAENADKGAL
jgi:cobaltochelatase CobS